MPTQLTADGARLSLNAHAALKGAEIFAAYGPDIGWKELQRILEDRACVRYPCTLAFASEPLQRSEFAHAAAIGDDPEEGFTLVVHPFFMTQLAAVPMLALYHLVTVNYGAFASGDDAVAFAAAALGLPADDYYRSLCELVAPITESGCG
jgi:hypothetical protein